jgi:hypothetical protein
VFGQELGLDIGWNCHISLNEDKPLQTEHATDSLSETIKQSERNHEEFIAHKKKAVNSSLPNLSMIPQKQTVKFNLKSKKQIKPHEFIEMKSDDDYDNQTDAMIFAEANIDVKIKSMHTTKLDDEEISSHQTATSEVVENAVSFGFLLLRNLPFFFFLN